MILKLRNGLKKKKERNGFQAKIKSWALPKKKTVKAAKSVAIKILCEDLRKIVPREPFN